MKNMRKNQTGVTLMILVVTIVIMSILIGSISYHSQSSFKMKAYYNMCSDIELLDEKIAIYYIQNKSLPITEEQKNINEIIPNYSEDNVNYNPNNSGTLYKIDVNKLENLSLNDRDYYIDEESHTIYSPRAVDLDDTTYYTYPIEYKEVFLGKYR